MMMNAMPRPGSSWVEVWRALGDEERLEATDAFWSHFDRDRESVRQAMSWLATSLRFRPRTVSRFSPSKKAKYLARRSCPDGIIPDILVALHFERRRGLMATFLDAAGIGHEDGHITDDAAEEAASMDALVAAIVEVQSNANPRELDLYLTVLCCMGNDLWTNLPEAMRATADTPAAPEVAIEEAAPDDVDESDQDAVPLAPGFTTLDRVLIHAAVGSASERIGALGEDAIEDLLDEVLRLNTSRHQSYFHRGFWDGLQESWRSEEGAELNLDRRTWYTCGLLHALKRRGMPDRLQQTVKERVEEVDAMAHGSHEASVMTAPVLYETLLATYGAIDVKRRLSPQLVARTGPALWSMILKDAGEFLRQLRDSDAHPLLSLLESAVSEARRCELPVSRDLELDLRRRLAHCARLRGDFESAETRLNQLLEEDLGPRLAMVRTDMALVRREVRALADIRLPRREEDMSEVKDRLESIEDVLQGAADLDGQWGGHAEFVLGVLAIARKDEPQDAARFLSRAVAEMSRSPDVYQKVLPRARTYLALSLAECLEDAHVSRIFDLFITVAADVVPESPYALKRIMVGVAAIGKAHAARLVDSLTGIDSDHLLDAALEAELADQLPQVRASLLKRCRAPHRQPADRFHDAESLLSKSLQAEDMPHAGSALDCIEDIVQESRMEDLEIRFLEILDDPPRFQPAWDASDARFALVRVLERRGHCLDAAAALQDEAHKLISDDQHDDAQDLVDKIRSYGSEYDTTDLEQRLKAANTGTVQVAVSRPDVRGTMLFIGGNETQARYDDRLLKSLRERHPNVKLEIHHTGWSSNWGKDANRVERQLAEGKVDAVVIMRLIRTGLGRKLRALCSQHNVRWVACTGHGFDSCHRAVNRAVELIPPANRSTSRAAEAGGS